MGRHSRPAHPAAAQPDPQPGQRPGPVGHRGRRRHSPARTGLLASSAVMTVGAVAVTSGLPGLLSGVTSHLPYGGGDASGTQADGPGPAQGPRGSDMSSPQGSATAAPAGGRTTAPAPARHGGAADPTATATATASRTTAAPASTAPSPTRTAAAPTVPVVTTAPASASTSPPVSVRPAATGTPSSDEVTAARARILVLVNQQRASAGCSPLKGDSGLDRLAQDFSEEMAARGFFDHTDPDGKTPWDRAKELGITGLGGENIARGQADAQAVMDAWMNSPGHRANILNCEFTTLGVGIRFGTGGPWWTQDFGY